jgi:hypothetical protein
MTPERKRAAGHPRNRADDVRGERDRIRIAQAAARLIAEHGISDWGHAKRKAARQLMLPESTAWPSNAEIEQALADYHTLFQPETHAASLRAQRAEALAWMRRLAPWDPLLVGGVAAGWATEHSDIRLELVADDPKTVEIALAGAGVAYAALAVRDDDAGTCLRIQTDAGAIRLTVVGRQHRRNRARRDDEPRLDYAAVDALLDPGRASHAAASSAK